MWGLQTEICAVVEFVINAGGNADFLRIYLWYSGDNINVVKDSESSLEGYGGDSINLVPIAF